MTPFIGVISDTHGLLRPEAIDALQGATMILHAGDVGRPEVLDELSLIAPVQAIRGNVDHGIWADRLPLHRAVPIGPYSAYLLHDRQQLPMFPAPPEVSVIITGHSHQPRQETLGGILYLNPGSAGPRRFRLPITLARLYLRDSGCEAELVELITESGKR